MTKWNRDLPAIEKRKAEEAADQITAHIDRILADHEQRMIEVNKTIAAAYAERDAKIAELRATRDQRIAENIAAANAKIFANIQ